MKYLSEKEYDSQLRKIKAQNIIKERKQRLREEKNKSNKHFKLPSFSKLILFSMIVMCFDIVFFVQYATIKLCDTNALYALVGIPVGLSPIIWGYYSKSKSENTQGGIIYDMAMSKMEIPPINENETNTDNNSCG